MIEWLTEIWSNDVYRKLISTALVILMALGFRNLFRHLVKNRFRNDSPYIFTINKTIDTLINILAVVLILGVWVQRIGDLSVALGIMGAGLAFALQEVIGSIAGWITIVTGRPFEIGDRIETGGIRGDVVDIGVLRTKLMEIGNWLGGDHNTGRIVTVSNAFIFKEPLFNYSRYLSYIWDEITIPVPYESNWQQAIKIMTDVVLNHPNYQSLLPKAQEQRRQARHEFAIKITPLEARTYVRLTDNWIELGLVYPVDIDIRRSFRSEVSQMILDAFSSAKITVASQTLAIVNFPDPESNTKR
jgi:small-conductance mechanosensitive channel